MCPNSRVFALSISLQLRDCVGERWACRTQLGLHPSRHLRSVHDESPILPFISKTEIEPFKSHVASKIKSTTRGFWYGEVETCLDIQSCQANNHSKTTLQDPNTISELYRPISVSTPRITSLTRAPTRCFTQATQAPLSAMSLSRTPPPKRKTKPLLRRARFSWQVTSPSENR